MASKRVHVVILAGGYNRQIALGAAEHTAAAAPPTGTPRQMAAAKASGTPRPPGGALASVASSAAAVPALLPLDGTPNLIRILQLLTTVQRVTLEAVWVVHNAGDEAAIKGASGLFAESPVSELGLPAVNFVSNGATSTGDWRGEVADLRKALAAMGAHTGSGLAAGACVAVISGELAFMPQYNMQRLLEHSYLRGRDVLGASHVNGVDIAILGDEGHTVLVPAEDSALPRIGSLEPHSSVSPGTMVAEPFVFLRPDTAAVVAAGSVGGAAGTLQELTGALMSRGTYVAGLDIMFGRYNLRTAPAVDYADRFFAFCSAAALDPSVVGLRPDAVLQPPNTAPGGITGALKPVPAAGAVVGRSTAAHFKFDELEGTQRTTGRQLDAFTSSLPGPVADALRGTDYEAWARMVSAFNTRFFSEAVVSGSGMKQYLLPPTFYMTATRRQNADILL